MLTSYLSRKNLKMAPKIFFTTEQVEAAKLMLSELPDLTKNRITREELLSELKEEIIRLSSSKGYTPSEIKSSLEKISITISEKSIQDIVKTSNTKKKSQKIKMKIKENDKDT